MYVRIVSNFPILYYGRGKMTKLTKTTEMALRLKGPPLERVVYVGKMARKRAYFLRIFHSLYHILRPRFDIISAT